MQISISHESLLKDVVRFLENPGWLPIEADVFYERLPDNDKGEFHGKISVNISGEEDVFVTTDDNQENFLLFRNLFGGGKSKRTHNALRILALAIKLDNEENLGGG